MAGIAIWAKWNPENPDSGKAAQREYMFYNGLYQRRRAAVKAFGGRGGAIASKFATGQITAMSGFP